MKILILNWRDPKNPKSGGAEIVTLEHAKVWIKKGNTVWWFSQSFPNAKKQEVIDGVTVFRKGNLSVYFFAFLFYLQHQNEIDVVVDEFHGLPFFTPLYVRKPIVGFIHEVAGVIWDYMFSFPLNKIGKMIEPLFFIPYTHVPFITAASSTVTDLDKVGISKKQITVIHSGVVTVSVKEAIKREKIPTYIFVGRLVKMKGIEDVLAAFKYISQLQPHAKLWVVGNGEESYAAFLKQLVLSFNLEKSVQFFGFVSQEKKFELYKRAHLLLHASIKEGWGLNIIEAASVGTPAIAYDVAGLVDSVKNEETGVIITSNTPMELAKQATELFNNKQKYQTLAKNAKEWSMQFTWEKAGAESVSLIEKVVSGTYNCK